MMNKHLLVVALIAFLITFVNSENWLVTVGQTGKNVYIPDNFDANVGDTVTFNFADGTHDVVQSDEFAKCIKSVSPDAFNTPVNTGKAASPPQVIWTLNSAGQLNYFCSVADHCAKTNMYAKINVLEAGKALKAPGVKDAPPPSTPPAQPAAPADDLPNQKPTTTAPTSASPSTSVITTPKSISSSNSLISSRNDIQLSVVIALLSLTCYFL